MLAAKWERDGGIQEWKWRDPYRKNACGMSSAEALLVGMELSRPLQRYLERPSKLKEEEELRMIHVWLRQEGLQHLCCLLS